VKFEGVISQNLDCRWEIESTCWCTKT